MKFEPLWDAAQSKSSSLNFLKDYRVRYVQVADDASTENASLNPALSPKLTNQTVRRYLQKKYLQLRNWRGNSLNGLQLHNKPDFTVADYKFYHQLYEFYKVGGLAVVPYELNFYNSTTGIEHKLVKEYPDLVSEYPVGLTLEQLGRYTQMKKKLLLGLGEYDYNSVLAHFYASNYFKPDKKLRKHTWYDVRQVELKLRSTSTNLVSGQYPVVTFKGNLYFWTELWLRSYLRSCDVKKVYSFGTVTYTLYPRYLPPYFLLRTNVALVQRWVCKELVNLLTSGYNTFSNFVRTDLGVQPNHPLNVSVRNVGLKDYELTVSKVWNPGSYVVRNGETVRYKLATKKLPKKRTRS